MATVTRRISDAVNVLRGVPWGVYEALRAADDNRHIRMTYLDGVLILMAPQYLHDNTAERLGLIVRAVAAAFHIPIAGARSTTFRRKGRGRKKGVGKEPDNSYYIANEARVRGKKTIDLEVDPPPDLAIEVDVTSDSRLALPVYARLGVPEVWRDDVDEGGVIWFGRLQPDGTYATIERSECLPMLTTTLVRDALARCRDVDESTWFNWLLDWARDELVPRHRDGGGA